MLNPKCFAFVLLLVLTVVTYVAGSHRRRHAQDKGHDDLDFDWDFDTDFGVDVDRFFPHDNDKAFKFRHQRQQQDTVHNLGNVIVDGAGTGAGAGAGDPSGKHTFYSYKSSTASFMSNNNGKVNSQRQGETIINDNGKVTKYKYQSP